MSKYLAAFEQVREVFSANTELYGDSLLVEEIPQEEVKTKSGLYMPSSKAQIDGVEANKPTFVRVLAVGAGFYDKETGADVPLEISAGDIVLIGKLSVNWFSTFGPIVTHTEIRLGLTRESEIKLRFKGQTGYDAVFAALEKALDVLRAPRPQGAAALPEVPRG